MKRVLLVFMVLAGIVVISTGTLILTNIQSHLLATNSIDEPVEYALLVLPKETGFQGSVAFGSEMFRARNWRGEVSGVGYYESSFGSYAVYKNLFGGEVSFSINTHQDKNLTCPDFVLWNGVFLYRDSACELEEVAG